MALAVMREETSIAVTGTRYTVAPTTGWPGFAAAPPTTRAPDALTTCPVNEPTRPVAVPACLAAVARTISAASTTVNADAVIQKRHVAPILCMSPTPSWVIILLALDIRTVQPGRRRRTTETNGLRRRGRGNHRETDRLPWGCRWRDSRVMSRIRHHGAIDPRAAS